MWEEGGGGGGGGGGDGGAAVRLDGRGVFRVFRVFRKDPVLTIVPSQSHS